MLPFTSAVGNLFPLYIRWITQFWRPHLKLWLVYAPRSLDWTTTSKQPEGRYSAAELAFG